MISKHNMIEVMIISIQKSDRAVLNGKYYNIQKLSCSLTIGYRNKALNVVFQMY